MASWSDVVGNRAIRGQKALGVTGRLQRVHALLALTRRSMRVLTPVVERATLVMFDARQHLPLGRTIVLQRIGDDHPGHRLTAFEELAEARLGSLCVAPPLSQN